ncbi:MAG: thioredoxin family protein [Bacteroidota bacterium]
MRYLFLIVISLACTLTMAQSLNNEAVNSRGQNLLLGKIDKSGLNLDNYKAWFTENYGNYQPDETTIKSLKGKLDDYSITIFMGTWCGDSKREVPRFYKIIEAIEFPQTNLNMIAVSNDYSMYKQSPQHEEKGLNIHRVPTFIFYKDGQEVNRIVEHPVQSLEKDIQKIVSNNDYEPNFEIVKVVNTILKEKGIKGLKRKLNGIIEDFKNKTESYSELNTYGSVLYTTNRLDEALAVCKLNLKLFPNAPRAYRSLARVYELKGKEHKAEKTLKKGLRKFPDNEDLTKSLNALSSK